MKKTINGIDYHYIDPTGNITLLVETGVKEKDRPEIAGMIMEHEPLAEQAGFVSDSSSCDIRLSMAAGEFCGNATMSAAALFCEREGLKIGRSRRVSVEASGCSEPVLVDITRKEDDICRHFYDGTVHMPLHKKISKQRLEYKGREYEPYVVDFDGITHIIAPDEDIRLSDVEAEEAVVIWQRALDAKCLGIMFVSYDKADRNKIGLRPLVYVPGVKTCFWESSCASGTTAVGACHIKNGMDDDAVLTVSEPGGILTVRKGSGGHVILGGSVAL